MDQSGFSGLSPPLSPMSLPAGDASSERSTSFGTSSSVRNEEFWQKKMTFQHSTFGASSKTNDSMKGFFTEQEKLKFYRNKDDRGNHHSRIRIISTFGKNTNIPGPGSYYPDYTKDSTYETSQHASVSSRPHDYEADEHKKTILFNKTVRSIQDAAREARVDPSVKQRKEKKSKKKKEKSALADVGVAELYASLLPGPGSYKPQEDWGSIKFDRPAKALMAPRVRASKSRPIIDFNSLDIISDRTKEKFAYGGSYNVQADPRKLEKKFTIGRQRPLLTGIELLPVGPGYYNDERAFPFIGSGVISRSPDKKSFDVSHALGT